MIILKKPERGDDLKFIQWLWSDEETMQDVGGTHCYDDEGIEKWYVKNFESDKNNMDYFLIFSQQENIPVGEVSYVIDDYEKEYTAIEELLNKNRITVTDNRVVTPSLENVFMYLIKEAS